MIGTRVDGTRWMQAEDGELADARVRLDHFLRGVERRALRMAELSVGDKDEALDVVQDSMLAFVRNYATKPAAEWPPLFHRVLDSRLTDWHRRSTVRGRWLAFLRPARDDDDDSDLLADIPDPGEVGPLARLAGADAGAALDGALKALPLRQRQAFLLRIWEGLDVADTATAMRCSEGSVKTHLWRALNSLRVTLEEHR
ncbi:RNA polymerase sigma factor [Tahibacter amnicola]|uniref:RNA polymerase sigma factor n=1 Tax=Tahibacter amnicola TaxID=2976241 RepID=A0ABY6BGX8_9GAMM|nr:RNA polymerase sigma factor [Tahibacter amnicola]UXI69119.1 RNA polymerase sigma factor [Tahibacter amnicola]